MIGMTAPLRSLRITDEDWAAIRAAAAASGETMSAYLRRRALEPDECGRALRAARESILRAREALADFSR